MSLAFEDKMDIYACDDCSLIHSMDISVPLGLQPFCYNKAQLGFTKYAKLRWFIENRRKNSLPIAKFVPHTNIESNAIGELGNLLTDNNLTQDNCGIFYERIKSGIMFQMILYFESLVAFIDISKSNDIVSIKQFFITNKRVLKKEKRGYSSIPEDDDYKIIAGYVDFKTVNQKVLVTSDEHFWGYGDLIKKQYNINVLEDYKIG